MTESAAVLANLDFDHVVPHIRDDVVLRQYGNEAVAWSPTSHAPVYLDPVAAVIFQLLDGDVSVGELIDDVHDVLGIPRSIARNQLRRVMSLLDQASTLTTSAQTAPATKPELFVQPPNP
jgi:hypothetical protein